MSSNNHFSTSQHDFRSNRSNETALLIVSDHILSATDCQEITLLCLLDLSKCFEVIDHSKLLSKLQTYSIDPTWFLLTSPVTPNLFVQLAGGGTSTYPVLFLTLSVFSKDPLFARFYSRHLSMTCPFTHRRRTWFSTLTMPKF